jgi:hypothetical protein
MRFADSGRIGYWSRLLGGVADERWAPRRIGGMRDEPWTPWRIGGVLDEPWTPWRIGGGLSRSDKSCLGGRGAWERGQLARRDNSLGEATADPLSAPGRERRKVSRGAPGALSSVCERGSASTGSLRSDVGRREVRSKDQRILPGAARTIDVLRGRSGTWWSKAVREAGIPRAAEPRGDHEMNPLRGPDGHHAPKPVPPFPGTGFSRAAAARASRCSP